MPTLRNYPPRLSNQQEQYILTTMKDWSIQHGLAVRPSSSFVTGSTDPNGVLASTAPVTLFPSPFPRRSFRQGNELQKEYNRLYAAISNNEEWIERTLKK